MSKNKINRRLFIKNTTLAATVLTLGVKTAFAASQISSKNLLPRAYPRYLSFDRSKDITADEVYKTNPKVLDDIDQLVFMAQKHGLHVSLNLHRGPGYCINAGFHEPFNLWKDKEAQDAF